MMEWNDNDLLYFERIGIRVRPRWRNRVRRRRSDHPRGRKRWWWPFWAGVCVGLYGILYWLVRSRVM